MKIIDFLKKYKDKILHFLGCGLGAFVISRFMHMNYAVFGTLMLAIGVEIGDLKNYGWAIIKSKDKEKIKAYVVNTVSDLIAGIFGIFLGALIIALI
jgi:hypothetical protein